MLQCILIYYDLSQPFLWNKHDLIQVFVTANTITIHKNVYLDGEGYLGYFQSKNIKFKSMFSETYIGAL